MLYEFKLKVNKVNEKGDEKEVTEHYITDDELFGHVELKGNELYNGECDVFAISRSKILRLSMRSRKMSSSIRLLLLRFS